MLGGPIPATEKVLQKQGLTVDDIDLFEVNEAFAPVVLAWSRATGAAERTNVNGGAIALGHPLGATGAKLRPRSSTNQDGVRPVRPDRDLRRGRDCQRSVVRACLSQP